MTATSNLYYIFDQSSTANDQIDWMPASGGASTDVGADTTGVAGVLYGLATDSVDGVYFVTSISGANSFIYEEHFGSAPQFSSPIGGGAIAASLNNAVTSVALNASDDILYFTSGTGFYEEKFGAGFSGTPQEVQLASFSGLATAGDGTGSTGSATQQLAFDQADHSAYFASPGYQVSFTTVGTKIVTVSSITSNYIYKVSGVTASATAGSLTNQASVVNLGGTNGQLPFSDGAISAITLDTANDTLYIATKGVVNTAATHAGIYAYNIHTGALSTVFSEVASGAASLTDMTYIAVDPTNGEYYVTDGSLSQHPGIYVGNINSASAPTLMVSTAVGGATFVNGLAIDTPPTVTSVAVTSIDGNASRTTGTVTSADTVAIAVKFSQNVTVTGTPTLTLNDGGSATYVSGTGTSTLVFDYKPASGQNTATLATTGENGGSIVDSASTGVNFGAIAQSFTGLAVQTTPPALSVTGAAGDVEQGGAAATLLQTAQIADAAGSGNIVKATIAIANPQAGDKLSIVGLSGGTVDGGAVTVTGAGTSSLILSGSASVAEYQTLLASVTYQDAGDDTTTVGHPTRTVDWTVDDGVFASSVVTSTATINRAPTLVASGSVNYSEIGSAVTLDSTLTASDPDGDMIHGATVRITSGFAAGDLLTALNDTANITSSYDSATGVLTLTGADTAANYQAALEAVTFSSTAPVGADTSRTIAWTVDDGLTSNTTLETSFVNVAPCYCRGSRILTARGEVAVEDLLVGDLVVTARGQQRPIVWIGHRDIEVARHPYPMEILPVRVRAGAFGEGLPRRDLWLSPQHAVLIDGALIPIIRLANGASVVQVRVERVSYFHVELETHDALLAEGLPAESFLDCGARAGFANAKDFVELHPTFKPLSWDDAFAPLVESGALVAATRARQLARAEAMGYRRSDDPALRLVADGREIWPTRDGDDYRFALPAGVRSLTLASHRWRPADADGARESDCRHLGVVVSRLEYDGVPLGLEGLERGWHALEGEGAWVWRWTDGWADMPTGAREIVVRVAHVAAYWVAPEAADEDFPRVLRA